MGKTVLLAALGFGAVAYLAGRAPLELKGRARTWFLLTAAGVNLWTLAALWLQEAGLGEQLSWFFLTNGMFLMAVTDLREKMTYDIHFYPLLLGGAAGAVFLAQGGMLGRFLTFLLLLGVLFLISRKKDGLGVGDSRMIACLALYFPLTGWMEIMLVSLGISMIYGLVGVARKKNTLKTEIPFMPFLLAAVLAELMM